MGLFKHSKKETSGEFTDQKWEYISLNDFKARGCGPGFAYFWLWMMLVSSIVVYGLDSFIAVNLLIFDQWSGSIKPGIDLSISKWIFTACILLSFVNLGYEAWRAMRVMKRGNVAECYLDPLAVRWESIRMGQGQGFKRFLVFAELTKSKQGAEYTALFTYFSLKAWIRVLFLSGPRQVVNAFTFKAVYESKLAVSPGNAGESFIGFFEKIGALYEEDYQQALVLTAMGWTFVLWAISLIFFIAAVLCYVFFLWHWIPRSDGGLSGYCARKVNKKLKQIVTQKVNKALAKGQHRQFQAELKAAKDGGQVAPLERMGTLPTLPNIVAAGPLPSKEDSLPQMPMLNRNETTTTLPAYSSRPASPGGIELNSMAQQRRLMPSRSATMASTATDYSYTSKASLLGSAADMGQGRPPSPTTTVPSLPAVTPPGNIFPPSNPGTPASARTFGAYAGMGHAASNSTSSARTPAAESPAPMYGRDEHMRASPGPNLYNAYNPNRGGPAPPQAQQRPGPGSRFDPYSADGRASPAPSVSTYHGGPPVAQRQQPMPMRSATGPVPPRGPFQPPQRNMTAPMDPSADYFNRPGTQQGMRPMTPQGYGRSATPQSQRGPSNGYDVESQQNRGYGY